MVLATWHRKCWYPAPWANSTSNFSITIQIRQKNYSTVIILMATRSQQILHLPQQRSCHVMCLKLWQSVHWNLDERKANFMWCIYVMYQAFSFHPILSLSVDVLLCTVYVYFLQYSSLGVITFRGYVSQGTWGIQQVEAQHQMWKISQIWQTFQIWWYRMLTPAPEMTQFSIQSIEEIVQSRCCQMFSSTLKFWTIPWYW